MEINNDPLGQAILDFSNKKCTSNITVHSDICDDDTMPVEYLFRSFNEMPEIEQIALSHCKGNILEVGCGTGCHAKYLVSKNFNTYSIDTSRGAIEYITKNGLNGEKISFLDLKGKIFDTLLILMNGLGLAGTLEGLPEFLNHAKSLLSDNGYIIADSSDIRYLYEDEEGGTWVDLNSQYLGEMQFQMEYESHKTEWFNWIYIDFETLSKIALDCGLIATKILENENFHYLVKLEKL